MLRVLLAAALAIAIVGVSPLRAAVSPAQNAVMTRDVAGGADNPLVGRYEGSILIGQTQKAFDELALPSGASQGHPWASDKAFPATVTPQGRVTRQLYLAPEGRSTLEVATNYFDALKAKGFEQIFSCARDACGEAFAVLMYGGPTTVLGTNYDQTRTYLIQAALEYVADPRYGLFKRSTPEGDAYVAVYVGQDKGGSHGDASAALDGRVFALVQIVEPKPMEQKIVTVSAAEIASKVAAEGRVAFYGIFFDFNKADVKPDSDPQLAEMARFIKEHADEKVFITGHTDNQGGLDYNLGLSQRRADAVAKVLATRFGVDAKRMTARGLASLAPVASNRTEEGRAKNRRVELVEQ